MDEIKCPKCDSADILSEEGSASGRMHHHCSACGNDWRSRVRVGTCAAAGQLGGQTRVKNQDPEERSQSASRAARARWLDHRLGQNKKLAA